MSTCCNQLKVSTPVDVELVVARYNEPLNWLRRVPPHVRVTIYDKSGAAGSPDAPSQARTDVPQRGCVVFSLPNVGREAHAYLWHIISRYDALSPLTVFCQARPFDHAYDFHHTLRHVASGQGMDLSGNADSFRPLGHIVDTDDAQGTRLFARWSKNEDGRLLDAGGFYRALFESEAPPEYTFRPGGQFVASDACIRRRPRTFYERALQLAMEFPDAAHCFERMWPHVFDVQNPDLHWLDGRKMAYLKPIRRMETPRND
jgi:hypothetical protein